VITIDAHEVADLAQRFGIPADASQRILGARLDGLGRRIRYVMKQRLHGHRYTGALEDSVNYLVSGNRVEIGPTAKRGRYDAGWLLQAGTGPISKLPFGPIAKWAAFRGLPAGPIWYKIKTQGVKAHPWLEDVEADGRTRVAIENTARALAMQIASYAVLGEQGGFSVASEPSVFG